MFWRTAWLVLRKDVAIEARSWEVLTTTLFFAVACVMVFAFAFVKDGKAVDDAAAGILWIAIAFSGTLALGRTFERERYSETLRALLLAPAPRPALYLGKLLGMLALLSIAEALLVPMVALMFQATLFSRPLLLIGLLGGGTLGFCAVGTLVRGDARARAISRRAAADPVVSHRHSCDYCGCARHGGAAEYAAGRCHGDHVAGNPRGVRYGVSDPRAVDVRTVDDGVIDMKAFGPVAVVAGLMLAASPFMIAGAPYESTMGLVQKIFYFHVPSWFAMFTAIAICGVASIIHLFKNSPRMDRIAEAAAEIAVLFGLMGLVTGPLWGRKAWGVWWQWDAKLTIALLLELTFISGILVRKYGGPGSDKLAAAVGIFGLAVVPFVYEAVNIWRTIHPLTSVVPTLPAPMAGPFWFCVTAFMLLMAALLMLRVNLGKRQAALDELYLALED